MGAKTKIDWCDSTWNPVTGCLHDCTYCYARGIAKRFGNPILGGDDFIDDGVPEKPFIKQIRVGDRTVYELSERLKHAYPFNFSPTLHRYLLGKPQTWEKPRTIFVGSMCDLFGEWVPDEWIQAVFDAATRAPQHRYLFLTKNPKWYYRLIEQGALPSEHWYGMTLDHAPDDEQDETPWTFDPRIKNSFVSIEPLTMDVVNRHFPIARWYIVGAMTGRGSEKHQPRREWVENIVNDCDAVNVPVFMKDSLIPIMGEDNMRREFPWEALKNNGQEED